MDFVVLCLIVMDLLVFVMVWFIESFVFCGSWNGFCGLMRLVWIWFAIRFCCFGLHC